jgi:hypothetical protein
MARQGTPTGGLVEITKRVYIDGPDLTLVCYTNTADSLGSSTVAANLTQPTVANGYAPIVLSGTWVTTDGVLSYTHPAGANADEFGNPGWFPTGTWSAAVTGVAIIYGTAVVHFMDNRDSGGSPTTFVAAAGKKFTVDLATVAS